MIFIHCLKEDYVKMTHVHSTSELKDPYKTLMTCSKCAMVIFYFYIFLNVLCLFDVNGLVPPLQTP